MPRKRKDIDWKTVEALVKAGCDQMEIAEILNVSADTLQRAALRDFNVNFSERFKHLHAINIKYALKKAMIEKALAGDTVMQIWVSKNVLGWSDKVERTNTQETHVVYEFLPPLQLPENKQLERIEDATYLIESTDNAGNKAADTIPTEQRTPRAISQQHDV